MQTWYRWWSFCICFRLSLSHPLSLPLFCKHVQKMSWMQTLWEMGMHTHMQLYVYYIYTYIHIYIHTYVYTYIYTYIYIYIGMYIYIYMCVCVCAWVYRVVYTYIYIYTYIYMVSCSVFLPPNGMGLQVAPPSQHPLPFYLQAIGSISEVQPCIC